MRKLGFALIGIVLGIGLALLLALPQSAGARAVDPQGLHLIGVIFFALPLGAALGLVLGLMAERLSRR